MKISTLISHTAELMKIIYKSSQPADKIASEYFRSKKYIGSKERKFLSELLFHSLRNYFLLQHIAKKILNYLNIKIENIQNIFTIISGIILFKEIIETNYNTMLYDNNLPYFEVFNTEEDFLKYILEELEISASAVEILNLIKTEFNQLNFIENPTNELLKIRFSINSTFLNSLDRYLDENSKINLLKSLCKSAPLNIRINNSLTEINYIENYFKNNSIDFTKNTLSTTGITINKRINIKENPIFKNGLIDIQDEGSQLISYALNPMKNTRILDACAGAGGKSLHIANICSDTAEIIASDIDNRKLNELLKRAQKSNFKSIKTIHIHHKFNFNQHQDFIKKFDYILIDAPCSGTGTTRRMPMPKYRINTHLIQRLQKNQLNILNQYSQFLKTNGILIYSTCSLLYEENQEVVELFLKSNNNFKPEPLLPAFDYFGIKIPKLKQDSYFINLLPHIHNTDGFFIAKFRKI